MARTKDLSQTISRELLEGLRVAGYRLTPQRTAVCGALARRDDHPTAQALYEELKPDFTSLSLTTVYQTLDALVKIGRITSLGSAGDDAIHFEVNTAPHINLACLTCHRICDLESQVVHKLEAEVQASVGSKVLSGRVVYYSECLECEDPRECPYNKSSCAVGEKKAANVTGTGSSS
ncbi:Fur family transcriptional regulator, peroxide stress response regulator [Alkalispirochaeta americana]|uniref:Fur family transcriptional regulator, peroxide stress response regulator n=1 Tax=Alkalispirochaeta americana TaxID=159291 RepID=A0A1N6UDL8_9SPIO|nr:Fur family transcriptional regulator [Alkalispirochaeta americana]SIQ63689.1 Fur family transcriptional regulator, peroxide stress response regulator [Alkalispirochaeta americana]